MSVLYTSVWELFDLKVDGRPIAFGSPAWRERLARNLDHAREVLTGGGARLVVVTSPCFRPENIQYPVLVPILEDTGRLHQFNAQLRHYAAIHPDVTVVDLHGLLCPAGRFRERMSGIRVRTDGVHYSPGGAQVVLRWLAPRLRAVAPPGSADPASTTR